ncbi:MAG: nickel pincer cofactor biosynthesis protein LarB [Clostridiales Family XIII bacterium]|jgi:NCAIR mutase (PurE)-related protein|nr:nickel pincer cofactor biosynthesis protein LarB [Clostridiales Family XIII bacterium]
MDNKYILDLLQKVQDGDLTPDGAFESLKTLPYEDMDYVKIDKHRKIRSGKAEVIFCIGKTDAQVAGIFSKMSVDNDLIIGTKASPLQYEATVKQLPDVVYHEAARLLIYHNPKAEPIEQTGNVAVVTAGTADISIAEEAAVTLELYGNKVDRIFDVGVAGIHRLLAHVDRLRAASCIIVMAGMEGALASVVGGLVDRPVLAVPTSIGYGVSQGGYAALISMLSSCALGVSVFNIDNGFGAAYTADMINHPRD